MDLKCEGKSDVDMDTLSWIHTHKTAALLKVWKEEPRPRNHLSG